MKVGIIYDDIVRDGLDCRLPNKGNPGVGGTQFCYLNLIYYLPKFYNDIQLIVYRYKEGCESIEMPTNKNVQYIKIDCVVDSVYEAKKDNVDLLLFTFGNVLELAPVLEECKVNAVVWIHNWIRGDILDTISNCQYIKRTVFLVREHYDRYIDDTVINKAVYIPNMFNTDEYTIRNSNLNNVVTYVGAIVPGKGFHVLAKAWKHILEKVPDAELYVLGKGNLYGKKTQFGDLNLAEKSYEDSFSQYLLGDDGKILPSVHLMGIMGSEKSEIYAQTKVGVVNPTGRTEVCPISALEMEAAGIPVVSKNTNGMPDVIENKKTGILIFKESALADAVAKLLKDSELNNMYSEEAIKLVKNKFNPKYISEMWYELFLSVVNGDKVKIVSPTTNYSNNFKWLRVLNYKIKKIPCFKRIPSIIKMEGKISKLLRGV